MLNLGYVFHSTTEKHLFFARGSLLLCDSLQFFSRRCYRTTIITLKLFVTTANIATYTAGTSMELARYKHGARSKLVGYFRGDKVHLSDFSYVNYLISESPSKFLNFLRVHTPHFILGKTYVNVLDSCSFSLNMASYPSSELGPVS